MSFLLCFYLVQGSGFRVEGSRGGFAAFFRGWVSCIAAFPSRGRCPAGADRVKANVRQSPVSRPLKKGRAKGAGWIHAAV